MSKTLDAASFYGRNTIRLSFSDNTWEEYRIGRGVIEFLVVSISDALANVRAAEAKVDALMREKEELREAAKAVVWFDWSDNDEDAVRAIERLRALVREQNTTQEDQTSKEDLAVRIAANHPSATGG